MSRPAGPGTPLASPSATPLAAVVDAYLWIGGAPRTPGRLDAGPFSDEAADPGLLPGPIEGASREALVTTAATASATGPRALLVLAGGEPTLRSDLLELVSGLAAASRHGVGPALRTDGAPLGSVGAVRALKDAGLGAVRVLLHAGRADAHDWLVGAAGSARRAARAVRVAADVGLAVTVETVVTRPTAPYLAETVELAGRLGARSVRLRPPFGAAAASVELAPRLGLLELYLEQAASTAERAGVALSIVGLPHCATGRAAPSLLPVGSEHWWSVRAPARAFTVGVAPAVVEGLGGAGGGDRAARCGSCPGLPRCGGAAPSYVERFGFAELASESLRPIADAPATAGLGLRPAPPLAPAPSSGPAAVETGGGDGPRGQADRGDGDRGAPPPAATAGATVHALPVVTSEAQRSRLTALPADLVPPPPRAGRSPATRLREITRLLARPSLDGDPLAGVPTQMLRPSVRVVFDGPSRVACPDCGDHPAPVAAEATRVLRMRLVRAAQEGATLLRIASAASLAHPAAVELLRETTRLSVGRVEVAGEGSALAALDDKARISLRRLARVDVAIYGPDAARHDAHVGRSGAFVATLDGLRRLGADAGIATGVYAVIHDARDVADLATAWSAGTLPAPPAFRLSPRGDSLDALADAARDLADEDPARAALAAVLPPCLLPRDASVAPARAATPSFGPPALPPSGSDRDGSYDPCAVAAGCAAASRCPGIARGWSSVRIAPVADGEAAARALHPIHRSTPAAAAVPPAPFPKPEARP